MENFPNSQQSTQGFHETQEVTSQFVCDITDAENVWGRLFSLRDNASVCNLINNSYTFGRGDADYRFSRDHFENAFLPAISKIHFRVSREWKSNSEVVVVIEDLSCNGTFVNKQQVGKGKKMLLKNNDEIALAHANKKVFVFYDCLHNDAQDYPEELTEMYTMTKKLGAGNFGEVRLAYKQGTLERCAVKIMKKKGSQLLLNNIKQINNEIKLLQSVDHPENILLATDEEYTRIKLTDFGLSKLAADASQMTTFCGTPTYIAPELLDFGALSYTNKVDLWSLGVVLFVSLACYSPFSATDEATLRYQIRNAVFSFQHRLWTEISEGAKDLITKLMVSEPSQRLDIEQTLRHPWLQDEVMQKKAMDLLKQDQFSPSKKRRVEESEVDELVLPDAKTPKVQLGISDRL
ncbi:serine/threonine-protein kinase Chk2 isoform X2 [Panulirus ornatus]|uniref:serine/threonine-protein kinase Chk2 isoform X2 n=1 Tax=Panulirus ornatus TaxID=150431 RepID=UPI003A899586